jgi:hypothetical protein
VPGRRPLASSSSPPVTRFSSIQALTDLHALQPILSPIAEIASQPLATVGFSGSAHDRIQVLLRSGARRKLILKHVHLGRAWTAYRTGDVVGREAVLLAEPQLHGIWEVFHCPYLAYAVEDGEIGLLMEDLSESLLPDVDAPLTEAQEDRLLVALASSHARYWDTPALDLPWLASPLQLVGVLGPTAGEEEARHGAPHPLFEMVARGWTAVNDRVPVSIVELLSQARKDLSLECAELPNTIIHGDAKVANFALFQDGGVAAFDWSWIGAGPCTLDLGWYLAVNAARLSRAKEEVVGRYRDFLQAELGDVLSDELWERVMRVGILYGALMLLWAKALALETGTEDAAREWDWWMDQLAVISKSHLFS